ncbi:SH2 domain containing 1A duplicate a isoform X2 [Triplophysa dalaica]|uniref:SH2 domain containing 1A duplicate a isoform X2 n=1 Tax=Triplophysa dalaica TaxID=1582913 RepID=UPI0024DFF800|nr:SH2 domain containing 1A duplicate a isoform X2 [Triplophysa dalaica]
MEHLAEYHGEISKKRAEEILGEAGRDGSYLIRDSERLPNSYCACVLCGEWVYTYRVFKQKDGYWTIELLGQKKDSLEKSVILFLLSRSRTKESFVRFSIL